MQIRDSKGRFIKKADLTAAVARDAMVDDIKRVVVDHIAALGKEVSRRSLTGTYMSIMDVPYFKARSWYEKNFAA